MVLDKIKIWITALLLLGAVTGSLAQNSQVTTAVILNGDTLPHFTLDAANAIGKGRYAARYYRQERRNVRLEYNVRKVYPYARIAASKISDKAPLMRLTITQGRILIRLIYRETNNTSFSHIREYRGAVNAYFWQSIALLFGHNLKADYDPNGEDAEIEAIVRKIQQENYKKNSTFASPR